MNDKQDERAVTIVVIGPHYWGRGETLAEAKKIYGQQGGRLSDGYIVLTFDADTIFEYVDGMGRWSYRSRDGSKPNPPTEEIHEGRFLQVDRKLP